MASYDEVRNNLKETANDDEITIRTSQLKQILQEKNKVSIVGKFFQWIDDNILDKTSRLWMYALEVAGLVVIAVVLREFVIGLEMIADAKTDIELKKAELFISSVKECITPIAAMVSTICAALPTVMGVFRSLKKKWENGNSKLESDRA